MKEAGRERDIEIAKLKGYKVYVKCNLMEIFPDSGTFDIPNWSTNRNDAWELLIELCKAERIEVADIEIKFGEHWITFKAWWRDWKFTSSIKKHGLDGAFADCVSQAWITWKEQNEKRQ